MTTVTIMTWSELLGILGSEATKGTPLNPAPATGEACCKKVVDDGCTMAATQPDRRDMYRKLAAELDTISKHRYALEELQRQEKSLWATLAESEEAAAGLIAALAVLK